MILKIKTHTWTKLLRNRGKSFFMEMRDSKGLTLKRMIRSPSPNFVCFQRFVRWTLIRWIYLAIWLSLQGSLAGLDGEAPPFLYNDKCVNNKNVDPFKNTVVFSWSSSQAALQVKVVMPGAKYAQVAAVSLKRTSPANAQGIAPS
jgi:hypothetical protein